MIHSYDSRESFTRSFKAYMGVTPTDYRKYGLTAIKQEIAKEPINMTYSKTTDEILRELNDFVAKAKETAKMARKCDLPWYTEFWQSIADKTDTLTDPIMRALTRVSDIAVNPDQITNYFNIIDVIGDTAFQMHVMAFHVNLTIARAQPEDRQAMQSLCERYAALPNVLSQKTQKIARLFNELTTLIFEDMRNAMVVKMKEVVRRAREASDMIKGYGYIKNEITYMADELAAMPIEAVTAKRLNDHLFKLPILQFSIDTDILRSGGRDKAMFDGIAPFKQSLEEALDFIKSLPEPITEEPSVVHRAKVMDDIGYEGNILLFFTRGEAEKLGNLLDEEKKTAFEKTCEKINHYIHFTQHAADQTELSQWRTGYLP